MDTGAIVGTTVQTMDGGDTGSLEETLDEADRRLAEAGAGEAREVVADKGYHSNRTMTDLEERGKRSYVSEPNWGRRRWKGKRDAQKAVYANRRRIRGDRGKRLLRRRGEKVERAFAHMLGTGGPAGPHPRAGGDSKTDARPGCGLQPRAADAEAVRLRHPACPPGSGLGAGRARGPRCGRRFGFYSPFHSRIPAPVGHFCRHSREFGPQTPKSPIPAQPGPLLRRVRHAQATFPQNAFIHGLLDPE